LIGSGNGHWGRRKGCPALRAELHSRSVLGTTLVAVDGRSKHGSGEYNFANVSCKAVDLSVESEVLEANVLPLAANAPPSHAASGRRGRVDLCGLGFVLLGAFVACFEVT